MKRMIDYKEFKELQQLANNNEQRLDYIEGAYTYFNLGLDDANFDHLLPSAPEDFQPQTLEIGDTVYIEDVATTLDADMIKEIFDSNLVILDCGSAPTNYPTVFLQRQYVDEDTPETSPRSAYFKAFVTYNGALYEYTMNVAEYDETSEEGGYISISCKENAIKPIYCHPINLTISLNSSNEFSISMLIFDNNSSAFTWNTFKQWIINKVASMSIIRIVTTGMIVIGGTKYPANYLYCDNNGLRQLVAVPDVPGVTGVTLNLTNEWATLEPLYFQDGVNRIN